MRKIIYIFVLIISKSLLAHGEEIDVNVQRFNSEKKIIRESTENVAQLSREIISSYKKNFKDFVAKDKKDYEKMLGVLHTVQFYSGEKDYAEESYGLFEVFESNYVVSKDLALLEFRTLANARLFEKANYLLEKYKLYEMEKFPKFEPLNKYNSKLNGFHSNLVFVNEFKFLRREEFNIPNGIFIVVVGNPLCGFTRQAVKDLNDEVIWKSNISQNSKWVIPPSSWFSPSETIEWNKNYPKEKFVVLDSASQWPELNSWSTPTFYVYRQGKVVGTKIGWRGKSDFDELLSVIKTAR